MRVSAIVVLAVSVACRVPTGSDAIPRKLADGGIDCASFYRDISSALMSHNACSVDADCTVIGGRYSSLRCSPVAREWWLDGGVRWSQGSAACEPRIRRIRSPCCRVKCVRGACLSFRVLANPLSCIPGSESADCENGSTCIDVRTEGVWCDEEINEGLGVCVGSQPDPTP
jgi:hypothetical protein